MRRLARGAVGCLSIDDEIDAYLEFVSDDLACGEFEDATGAFGRDPNAPWAHVFGQAEDAHLSIEKHDVDGETHA